MPNDVNASEQLTIFDVLRTLPDSIETPAAEVDSITIETGGGGQFPVRVYSALSDDYEAVFIDLAE